MPGFMRSSENKILPDIVSRQQLRIKGLEQTINMLSPKFKASVDRENILSNELYKERKENIELQYTLKQLKIKCDVYEKDSSWPCGYAIHEPSEVPSVRWITYSNFREFQGKAQRVETELSMEVGSLTAELKIAQDELEEYHVGGR